MSEQQATNNIDQLKQFINSSANDGQVIEATSEVITSWQNLSDVKLQEYAEEYDQELSLELQVPVYTITKDNFPSQLFSLTFKEPLFEDRREATRMYPTGKVGYSLEELLLANMVLAINFERVDNNTEFRRNPISKFNGLPDSDKSYMLSTFLTVATLNDELSASIKNKTDKVLQDPTFKGTYCIPAVDMPTASFSLAFKEPLADDRFTVERLYPGASDKQCGYTLEEMLCVHQITHIDGVAVKSNDRELINIFSKWSHIDVQYAVATFSSIFGLTAEKSDQSRILGKSFLAKRKARLTNNH